MHVLLTGAGGFSGAEVVNALLAAGHRVTAVVGSTPGRTRAISERAPELEVISGDLAGEIALPRQVDAVVHAAARSPLPGVSNGQIVRDNVVATQRLIAHAKLAGTRTFVFFSSLSVHGRIDVPIVDEATPVRDPDVYGMTKKLCEELLAAEAGSFRSLAIRLPGVIGPGSVRNWLTGVLAAAKQGQEIVVYNPEAKYNNAAHVSDLAQFVCGLLEGNWHSADAVAVGAAGSTTVMDAARLLVDAFGRRSSIRIEAPAKPAFMISSARACERYGYRPMEICAMLRRFAEENGGRVK